MGDYQGKCGTSRTASSENRIHFDCRFTSTIRKLFKQKRIELGLAYSRLADLFGANWSTIRKWENGPTESCELLYRPLIEAFLTGDYDRELTSGSYYQQSADRSVAPVPFPVHQCMERVVSTYLLCMHEQSITDAMLAQMEAATSEALKKLVSGVGVQMRHDLDLCLEQGGEILEHEIF